MDYIKIGNKKIEISKDTAQRLKAELGDKIEPTPSDDVAVCGYKLFSDYSDFSDDVDEVLITDEPERKIFVNQKFANGSKFGSYCIFIKCKFGSDCEFGSGWVLVS